ncbi:MAG: nitrogenase component 1 [Lachnospiraceae bacterium]
MLKKLGEQPHMEGARTTFGEARFPAPYAEGLEFSSPARGTWNIVHTGFLIPEAHEIFVCARGCLRGVVLTAAEANALSRYSAIEIREENILNGNMEELMVEGVADVLRKLPYRPRAVLLYISCQHFFMAYDQSQVFAALRERFPDIRFADCYMIPTLRKSGLTPDQKMRIQLYSMLEPAEQRCHRTLNFIGSNLPIHPSAEWLPWLSANGFTLTSLHDCRTFDDYLAMANASANLYYEPLATMAAKSLEERLGQEAIYLPFVFSANGLRENYRMLSEKLHLPPLDVAPHEAVAEKALAHAREVIGNTPIAVDYTFTFRLLSFTRLLLEHDFHVTEIYADSFLPEEAEDFAWIREHFPDIAIWATNRPEMRFAQRICDKKILAIGQKAAYFTGTEYFVNVAESGGYYGFEGICQIAKLMEEAFLQKKAPRDLIQRKGFGCESCI